jgi:hypothetical protein
VYTEPDRVTAVETVIEGTRELGGGKSLRLKLVWDALTGASANGAVPAHRLQTFTRPSGRGSYTTRSDATPLDDTFRDNRFAGSAGWTLPLGRLTSATVGANASTETDYLSLGLSGGISRDLALRNTTISAGFSVSRDRVSPHGGFPTPFAEMQPPDGGGGGDDEDDEGEGGGSGKAKTVVDLLAGLSQVLDRATLLRLSYTYGHSRGYLTDPYKILSVVQGPGGQQPGDPVRYLFERRPDARSKQSVYGELRRMIGHDVALGSYRYFWDDWGVRSHTLEMTVDLPVSERNYLKPHVRYYRQTAASFYSNYLLDGDRTPDYASADYRLGAFHATTFGLELGHRFHRDLIVHAGVETMLQRGDNSPPAFGALEGQDLFPDVQAWMLRVGASMPVRW